MAARGKSAVNLWCHKIPVLDEDTTDREKLMSETWGRILLCVNKDKLSDVFAVLQPKQLASEVIGEVIEGEGGGVGMRRKEGDGRRGNDKVRKGRSGKGRGEKGVAGI